MSQQFSGIPGIYDTIGQYSTYQDPHDEYDTGLKAVNSGLDDAIEGSETAATTQGGSAAGSAVTSGATA
jgi:hypothetical protein